METIISLRDIRGLIRRRYKLFFSVFLIIVFISAVIALALPSIYSSTAMILIEEQQIPQDFVKSTITSYAEERLQMITRQIMKYSQLIEIIQQFKLYPEMVQADNLGKAVGKMRNDISIEPISMKEGNRSATVAFTLSYEGPDPVSVKKVADALSQLYLKEELKAREKQASVTTDFLKQELENLRKQVETHEDRLSEFKSRHIGELPENTPFNMQNVSRLEMESERIGARIRTLEDRKIYLKGQLASIEPLRPVTTEQGEVAMNPAERLKRLRLDLVRMQARLSDKHPDIRKVVAEITKLEDQVGHHDESVEKIKMLRDKKEKLSELQGRLSPQHPDVKNLKKEIDILSRQVDKLLTEKSILEVSESKPDNPAYINIVTQVVAAESEIKSLKQEEDSINNSLAAIRNKISSAPLIAKEYSELTVHLDSAKQSYNEILNKLMTAKVSQQMEEQQIGEKFTILEPAFLPSSPSKPNRAAIILLGFVLASGMALGSVAIQERMDQSFKNEEELGRLTGLQVLTSLVFIETMEERKSKRRKIRLVALGTVGVTVIVFMTILFFAKH
jgi:polysaccharide biosynthesis transport protein